MGSFGIEGLKVSRDDIILKKYVSIPSTTHGYSIAIEYIRDWILSKFPENFFKTVHVNGKHVLADYRKFKENQKRMIEKPALAIIPKMNPDYNRDNVDLIQGGLDLYTRRSVYCSQTFMSDDDNNIYLDMQMKQIQLPVDFRMRVKSRAQQLDLLEFVRIACRIGSTQGEYIDIDCHVPYDIMIAIAKDCGFQLIVDEKSGEYHIKDIVSFLRYLNSHSLLNFVYKFRTANGRNEFFIRLKNCYTHIACLDGISIDDGERQGTLDNNFHVDFSVTLTFPVPAIFVYNSKANHRIFNKEPRDICALYQIVLTGPPEKDENNWSKYLTTQWVDPNKKLDTIEFESLLENFDLKRVLKFTIDTGVSPQIFMNIKMYNGQHELPLYIDWEKYIIHCKKHDVLDEVSDIAIYVDLEYMNNTIANIDNLTNNRIQK